MILSSVRVLHLEDNAIDGDLVAEFLRADGLSCQVDRVWTREAFAQALAAGGYHLILADHQLPSFDGEAALALAREAAPLLPFVFVSGTLGEEVAVDALKHGATDYVVKQRLERLPGVVRRALAEAVERAERRRAEEALRALNATLEQRIVQATAEREAMLAKLHDAQKLETIGQLTGGVAHDFNNLLTPIVGSLDMLRRRLGDDDRSQRLISAAMQAAERAKTLVQRLLAFARRQVLDPRAVSVGDLVRDMAELIARSVGPQITLTIVAGDDLPAARVDPGQLELALLNLAVNARDAMAGGGTLTIATDWRHVGPGQESGLRHGDYVRLSVTDTGIGMDAATLRRAVEPFYSTKGIGKGTGLGLSMVHGLAAQSGGGLILSSTPGVGTRAEIWLPVANEQADRRAGAAPPPAIAARPATILLVDDEAIVRAATVGMLADLGHQVIEAGSGAQALELLRTGAAAPDLVITDYLMPIMNGAELAREIRALRPGLPILLATGYASLAGNTMADLPLLPKPFRQSELAATVERLVTPPARTGARPPRLQAVE